MEHAETEINPTRRVMLAGSGALLAGVAALARAGTSPDAANPDAELLALCARAEALYRRIYDCYAGGATPIADDKERELALDPIYDLVEEVCHELSEMEAKSLAGHRARARVILAYHEGYDYFEQEICHVGPDGVVLAALVRDLVAGGAI